jgi:hypothetical protein
MAKAKQRDYLRKLYFRAHRQKLAKTDFRLLAVGFIAIK